MTKYTANDLCNLFSTGQYGRFYVVSNWDRDPRFRIQILPEGEVAKPNGKSNLCLNSDAVLVYGHVANEIGNGKKDTDWIYKGKWVDDFGRMVVQARAKIEEDRTVAQSLALEKQRLENERIQKLLSQY